MGGGGAAAKARGWNTLACWRKRETRVAGAESGRGGRSCDGRGRQKIDPAGRGRKDRRAWTEQVSDGAWFAWLEPAPWGEGSSGRARAEVGAGARLVGAQVSGRCWLGPLGGGADGERGTTWCPIC